MTTDATATTTVVDTGRRHGTFHPLRVSAVEPLTDDAVAITFEVPDDLRADYVFDAGQHLTLRTEVGGTEVRRNFPADYLFAIGREDSLARLIADEVAYYDSFER